MQTLQTGAARKKQVVWGRHMHSIRPIETEEVQTSAPQIQHKSGSSQSEGGIQQAFNKVLQRSNQKSVQGSKPLGDDGDAEIARLRSLVPKSTGSSLCGSRAGNKVKQQSSFVKKHQRLPFHQQNNLTKRSIQVGKIEDIVQVSKISSHLQSTLDIHKRRMPLDPSLPPPARSNSRDQVGDVGVPLMVMKLGNRHSPLKREITPRLTPFNKENSINPNPYSQPSFKRKMQIPCSKKPQLPQRNSDELGDEKMSERSSLIKFKGEDQMEVQTYNDSKELDSVQESLRSSLYGCQMDVDMQESKQDEDITQGLAIVNPHPPNLDHSPDLVQVPCILMTDGERTEFWKNYCQILGLDDTEIFEGTN